MATNKLGFSLVVATLLMTILYPVNGAIFVSTTGVDSRSGVNAANSVRTITKAAELAASVDTIFIVDDGEYQAVLTGIAKNLTITGNLGNIRTVTFTTVTTWMFDSIPSGRRVSIVGVNLNRPVSASVPVVDAQFSEVSFSNLVISGSRTGFGGLIDGFQSKLNLASVNINGITTARIIMNDFGQTSLMNCRWSNIRGIGIQAGSVSVHNCTFTNWNSGSIFLGVGSAFGEINVCSFTKSRFLHYNGESSDTMLEFVLSSCEILIDECEFLNITTGHPSNAPAIVVSDFNGPTRILRSNFTNIGPRDALLTNSFGGVLSIDTRNTASFDSCRFVSCGSDRAVGGGLVLYSLRTAFTGTSEATIRNCFFSDMRARIGGAVYAQGQRKLLVENSIFQNNAAFQYGGAIAIGNSNDGAFQNVNISGSTFRSNRVRASALQMGPFLEIDTSVSYGGAISIDGPIDRVLISRNTFMNNSAVHTSGWANGGAVSIGAYFDINSVIVDQNTFESNIAQGWETASGGAFSFNGKAPVSLALNVFRNNSAVISASSPGFFDPLRRMSFGGGAFIAGFASEGTSTSLEMSSSIFESNSAGQGGGLHLQELDVYAYNCSVRSNRAAAGAGGLLLMYSRLMQTTPTNLVNLDSMTFSSNILETPGDAVRVSNCSRRGVQSQRTFSVTCSACNFDSSLGFVGVDLLPYGSHIGSVGGELFSLNGPSRRLLLPEIYPCNRPGGPGCFGGVGGVIPRSVDVLPDHSGIVVSFNSPALSFASNAQQPSCENLLTNETLNQPGWDRTTSSCIWNNRLTRLFIRAKALPFPAFVSFAFESIVFEQDFVSSDPFSVNPAKTGPRFTAIAVAPKTLDPCADSLISGASSIIPGVFTPVFNWTVLNSVPLEAAVVNFLNNQSTASFILPFTVWPLSANIRTITLALRVTSAGQPLSAPSRVTFIHPGDPKPDIFLEGPAERKQFAALETQLNARVVIPSCLTLRGAVVRKQWDLIAGTPTEKMKSPWFAQSYYIPASGMVAGRNYTFRFSANATAGSTSLSRSIDVAVEAIFSPILIYSSGDGGYVSRSQSASLEVTIVDPDNSAQVPSFVWDIACYNLSSSTAPTAVLPSPNITNPYYFPRFFCDCANFRFGASANNSVAPDTMSPRVYTALVDAAKDTRTTKLAFRLNVTDSASPFFRVRLIPRWNGPKPSPMERVAVSATVEGVGILNLNLYRAEWMVFHNDSVSLPGLISPQFVTTPLDGSALAIAFKPSTLAAGSRYTLQLSIYDRASQVLRGRNWLDFQMNDAPTGGSVIVTPSTIAQYDSVSISMPGWADADLPLRYTASVVLGQSALGDEEVLLTDLVDVESMQATIPFAGQFALRVRVIDALGTAAMVDTPLNVLASSSNADYLEDIQTLLEIGDLRRASGLLVALSSSANATVRNNVALSLQKYVSQTQLTATHSLFVLRMLQRINVTRMDAPDLKIVAVDLITAIVESVFNSTTFGASAFTLLSDQSTSGAISLRNLVSVTSDTLSAFQSSFAAFLNKEKIAKLVDTSFKLAQIMSRVSLLNESATTVSSSIYEIASLVRCGDGNYQLDLRGSVVSVDPDVTRNCTLGKGVAFDAFSYLAGSFPAPFYYNATNSTSVEPSLVPVICIGLRPLETDAATTNWNTTVTFTNPPVPTSANLTMVPTCVRFDSVTLTWSSDGCSLVSAASGDYTCQCSVFSDTSASNPSQPISQPPKSVLLSLAFGSFSNAADVLIPQTPTFPPFSLTPDGRLPPGIPPEALNPTSGSEASGSGGLSTVGIAAIAAVASVIVVACIVAVVVYVVLQKKRKDESMRVRRAISSTPQTNTS